MAAAYLDGIADAQFKNWSHGRVELSWPRFVIDLCNWFGERTKTYVINGASKTANQVVQEADEVAMEKEDGVHAADAKYETNKVITMGIVAAKNEEKPELIQAILNDKKEKAIVEEEIEVLPEEILVESVPRVYTRNQQVGGWGKPPSDEYGSPLHGDVSGIL